MARAVPRWARDTDSGTQLVEAENDKMMLDVRRERLQIPREIASLPIDPERARVELTQEQRALRLPSRGGRRWKAIAAFDERVHTLERRQGELRTERAGLHERLPGAELADTQRLADWHEQGRQGERPAPGKAVLEQQLERIDEDVRALDRLVDETLDAKAQHVERHRKKLVREAQADVTRAHGEYVRRVRELEQAREDLVESRHTLRWGRFFPGEAATSDDIRVELLAGGLLKPVKATLGTTAQVAFPNVAAALTADADALRDGLREPEDGELDIRREAIWERSDEGVAALERERQRIIAGLTPRNVRAAGWEE